MYPLKRLTILCGHYGSGKTNVAVNIAAELARHAEPCRVQGRALPGPGQSPGYSLFLWILPLMVLGSSSRKTTIRGYL